jgi:hypothetical protein
LNEAIVVVDVATLVRPHQFVVACSELNSLLDFRHREKAILGGENDDGTFCQISNTILVRSKFSSISSDFCYARMLLCFILFC